MIIGEYFLLPTTDTSTKFIYRLKFKDVIGSWSYDYIFLTLNPSPNETFEYRMSKFILEKYRTMIASSICGYPDKIPNSVLELFHDYQVKLVECDIAPKRDPDGYMKEII